MSEAVEKLVNPKRLVALIKDGLKAASDAAKATGDHGQRVKDAEESGHLHRKAFAYAKRCAKMDELKRIEYHRMCAVYYDMCEKEGLFGKQHEGDLADQAKSAADKEFDDADPDKKAADANAKALNGGISTLTPPDPPKESQTSKATRKRQEAETAAQAAVQKTIDEEARGNRFNKRPVAETIN